MMQMTVTPTYVILSPLLFSVTVYTLISLGSSMDYSSIMVLIILLSIGTSQNFIGFYFAIQVYKESKPIVDRRLLFKRKGGLFAKMVTRYWKSFPVVKVHFFQGNFFEKCTSLVLFDFSVNQALSLVLMDR